MSTVSLPSVALTISWSLAPSLLVPSSAAARLALTVLTSVPARLLTVTVSAPPRALKSTLSMPAVFIVMLPWVRKNRSRLPFADRSTWSVALPPLNTIVSLPSWPSIVSLPSPGSQTKASAPAPSCAWSLPPLPSTESLPPPPRSVSAPLPPASVSFPAPPSSVVGMLSVNAPLRSSMRTRSSPASASTTIRATCLILKLNSAEPSSPRSTWRTSGRPACRRSAIASLASVPSTESRPCLSSACAKWCALC